MLRLRIFALPLLCLGLSACHLVAPGPGHFLNDIMDIPREWGPTPETSNYASAEPWHLPGFYGQAGVFYAIEDFDDTGSISIDNSLGGDLRLGYRMDMASLFAGDPLFRFAFELVLAYYDEFDLDSPLGSIDGYSGTLNMKIYNILRFWPETLLPQSVQPYTVIGGGVAELDLDSGLPGVSGGDESGALGRFGLGTDIMFNQNAGAYIEATYNIGGSDLDGFDFWVVGAGFVFNIPSRGPIAEDDNGA